MLSVLIITYNHEQYIDQTLQSVLMQKTNVPFEVVIGDDASKDKTRQLCEAYVEKYPNIVRLTSATQNLGVVPNYIRTFEACQGKYIAHLDGDDYWIDPLKLQKQVDRLEEDPQLTMCYTSRRVFREDWNGFYLAIDGEDNKKYYAQDFAGDAFFHLSTLVFRKPNTDKVIQKLATFKNIVDRPLSIILLEEMGGYAIKIPDTCIVFRMNNNSMFTPVQEANRINMTNEMYMQLKKFYPHLSKYFNYHLNVAAYFMMRDAYRKRDKMAVRQYAKQILNRRMLLQHWEIQFKTALHILPSVI